MSQTWNSFRASVALDQPANRVPPIVVKVGDRPGEFFAVYLDSQLIASDLAQLPKWNVTLTQDRHCLVEVFWRSGNDDARLRIVEQCSDGRAGRFLCARHWRPYIRNLNLRAEPFLRIETTFRSGN